MAEFDNPYSPPEEIDDESVATHSPRAGRSVLGSAAITIGLVSTAMFIGLFSAAAIVDGVIPEGSPVEILLGLGFIASGVMSLVGVGLAIAGIGQTRHDRGQAIGGLVLNLVIVLLFVGILAVAVLAPI